MKTQNDYAILIEHLSQDDGGGYVATVPDLPGCMGDGETRDEALKDVLSAIKEWVDAAIFLGKFVPEPSRKVA